MSAPSHELRLLGVLMEESGRPRYGLELAEAIKVRAGTIYPTLARMERNGWLQSSWEVRGEGPRRRLYWLTERGLAEARCALAE